MAYTDEQVREVELHTVVSSTLRMVTAEVRRTAQLRTELAACPEVMANETRLGQVLVNLVMNAAQALPDRPPADNEIVVRAGTDAAGHAILEVRDNGAGMSADVLARASAVIHYMCSATAESTNQIQMALRIENKSTDALPMANVKIRYWLTPEATPELHQYYVHQNLLGPKAELVTDGENSHVVLSFTGGSIPAGNRLNEGEVQLAAANNSMPLNQANDFSFDPTAATFKPNAKITLYLQDKLIWGCEPSGACFDDEGGGGGAGAGGEASGGENAGGAPMTDVGGAGGAL